MILLRIIEFLRARIRLLLGVGAACLFLAVLADALPFLVDKSKAHTAAEKMPGFWALFGLAGAFLLISLSKALGALGLQRPEEDGDD